MDSTELPPMMHLSGKPHGARADPKRRCRRIHESQWRARKYERGNFREYAAGPGKSHRLYHDCFFPGLWRRDPSLYVTARFHTTTIISTTIPAEPPNQIQKIPDRSLSLVCRPMTVPPAAEQPTPSSSEQIRIVVPLPKRRPSSLSLARRPPLHAAPPAPVSYPGRG